MHFKDAAERRGSGKHGVTRKRAWDSGSYESGLNEWVVSEFLDIQGPPLVYRFFFPPMQQKEIKRE